MNKHNNLSWRKVMDEDRIRRSISRIAYEIVEKNKGACSLAIVGIRTRGEILAKRIHNQISIIEKCNVPWGVVDISLYRDDLAPNTEQPLVRGTELSFYVEKYSIILVDDVLFTGRTVRAAIDAIIDFGRPRSVQLAVLCDRGHKELPIRADYVGKTVATTRSQELKVHLVEQDKEDAVYVSEEEGAKIINS